MSRQVKYTVKDNKVEADFEGFEGTSCYELGQRILDRLSSLGVNTNSERVTDKRTGKQVVTEKERVTK